MPPVLSVYLDVVRFIAALVVVFGHSWLVLFPGYPLHWPGPPAVIVFFVLSGLVIASVTDGRDRTLADYALNRLSRLWSVALPALGFGMALLPFTGHSAFGPAAAKSSAVLPSAANALFLGENWFVNAPPPLNGPFWSLNYEAWFYAIFGAWAYLSRPAKIPASCLLALLAGPKILLLMPCWLIGVLAYRSIGRWTLSERAGAALWAVSLGAALILVKSGLPIKLHDACQDRWPEAARLLAFSGSPLTDYPLAMLVGLNFFAAAHIRRAGRFLLLAASPIRACASVHPDDLSVPHAVARAVLGCAAPPSLDVRGGARGIRRRHWSPDRAPAPRFPRPAGALCVSALSRLAAAVRDGAWRVAKPPAASHCAGCATSCSGAHEIGLFGARAHKLLHVVVRRHPDLIPLIGQSTRSCTLQQGSAKSL